MKKIICIIIVSSIIILFSYPFRSQAIANATVYLEANTNNVIVGDEIEVNINLKGQKVSAYSIDIYFDRTKLEFVSGPENSNTIGNKVKIVWYDKQGGSGAKEGKIENLRFKLIDTGIADFTVSGEFFDENANLIQTDFENLEIQILEQENITENMEKSIQRQDSVLLQSLRLDVEGIVPDFEPDVYDYDLTLPNELKDINNIDVQTIAENTNARIDISGNKNLKEGLNVIKIIVTNQEKNQEYKINVTKTNDISLANANLENLAIEYAVLSPEFNNQVIQYNTQVSNEMTKLNILTIPENEQGKVEITGNNNLNEGNNKIEIKVIAPNGFTQRIYIVNVYKRNKQEEEIYNQEVTKVQERLEKAYSVDKTVSNDDGNSDEIKGEDKKDFIENQEPKNHLLVAVDVFIIIAIIIGFLVYKIRKNKKIEY